jgi:hypothetical protein
VRWDYNFSTLEEIEESIDFYGLPKNGTQGVMPFMEAKY